MKLESVELRRIRLPLVAPFRTSLGTEREREILLVRVVGHRRRGLGGVRRVRRAVLLRTSTSAAHSDVIREHLLPGCSRWTT